MPTVAEQGTPPRPSMRRGAFLAVAGLFGVYAFLTGPARLVLLGWFLEPGPSGVAHNVHEISFGALFTVAIVGLALQFRRTVATVAPMLQVAIALLVLVALVVLVGRLLDLILAIYVVPVLVLLALHPLGARLFRPPWRRSAPLLLIAALAALPLLTFAATEVRTGLQARTHASVVQIPPGASEEEVLELLQEAGLGPEERALVEHAIHWPAMAAFGIVTSALLLLAALRPPGWRATAWCAAGMLVLYGAASLAFPTDASAHGGGWGVLAVVAGVAFAVTAEAEARTEASVTRVA